MVEVIDADGHLSEDYADILNFYSGPLKGKIGGGPLMPRDHLHVTTDSPDELAVSLKGTPDEWIEFLDKSGVQQTVIYPSGGLSIGMVVNVEYAVAYCQAYNSWLHARYLTRDERLHTAGLVPIADVDESVAELRRANTELGINVFMLPSNGQAVGKHLGDRMYWPLYAEAERLGCVLSVHGGRHHFDYVETYSTYYPVHAMGHPLGLMLHCAGMISHGVFDRFPKLKVAFLEGGSCWLPFVMERLERSFETHSDQTYRKGPMGPTIEEPPAEYIRRLVSEGRLAVGFDLGEQMLSYAVERAGNGGFVYATDFPHEGLGVDYTRHEIDELLARKDLSDEAKEAVLAGNARRLYGLA
jgi:uncharacterized protein